MSSSKRVTGNYNIYADNTNIYGNLYVLGNSAQVDITNTTIKDNTIVLNNGEITAGVAAGNAGIQIDRGTSADALWVFTESNDSWGGYINGSLTGIKAAAPVTNDDVVTRGFLFSVGNVFTGGGTNASIQYNNFGILGGSNTFNYFAANGNVQVGNTFIANNGIITTNANIDLVLDAGGTATTFIKDTVKMSFKTGATPTNVASTIQLLANIPGQGGTGLYIVNSNYSDELVSKRKATWLGLVFS